MKYLIKTKHNRRVQNSPIFSFIQRPNVPHGLALPAELIPTIISKHSGPGSTVGIATGYGLDGPVIESRLGVRFSVPVQTGPGAHPASCTMGTGSFPEVKSGRGVTLTLHTLRVEWSWKSRAIPLLPLWAVRPVQSLSNCTRVLFTLPMEWWLENSALNRKQHST